MIVHCMHFGISSVVSGSVIEFDLRFANTVLTGYVIDHTLLLTFFVVYVHINIFT